MKRMIKAWAGSLAVASLLFGAQLSGAGAADLVLKAPPLAAGYDWSGFYLGMNYGQQWQRHSWAYDPSIGGAANQSWVELKASATFGGHFGLQKQWGQFVLGAEVGGNTDVLDRAWDDHICPNVILTCQTRIRELFTAGGRFGYAFHGGPGFIQDWLVYGSGGWARGIVETRVLFIATGVPTGEATSNRQGGWYLGGGVETVLFKDRFVDLIAGLDYKHVDLGTTFQCVPRTTCGVTSNTNRDVGATSDILTARLSLKIRP